MAPVFAKHGATVMEILTKAAENGSAIDIQDLFF